MYVRAFVFAPIARVYVCVSFVSTDCAKVVSCVLVGLCVEENERKRKCREGGGVESIHVTRITKLPRGQGKPQQAGVVAAKSAGAPGGV